MWIKIQNNILAPGVTWGRLLNMTAYMFDFVHPGYLTKVSALWIGWMLHRREGGATVVAMETRTGGLGLSGICSLCKDGK